MNNQTTWNTLKEAFELALNDVINFVPKILMIIVIITVFFVISLVLNKLVTKILKVAKIDELLKIMNKNIPISISGIIQFLINIGLALIALYTIILLVLPGQINIITSTVMYISRVASVAFIIILVFILLNVVIERIRMETKMRGFMFLITYFIVIILIIDVTTLSQEVKSALSQGISLGIGLAIGVFTAWYFFGEAFLKRARESKG